jgi:hypothetical protein
MVPELSFFFQLKFLGSGSEEGQLESSSCLEPDLEENEVGEEDEEEYEQDEVLDESESVFLVEEPSHEPSTNSSVTWAFINDKRVLPHSLNLITVRVRYPDKFGSNGRFGL